jgi:two-component system sensor histidine kinase YesM
MRRKHLRDLPIAAQLILVFTLLFTVLFSLSLATYLNFKNDKVSSLLQATDQMNAQTALKLDEWYADMNSLTKLPLFTENTQDSMDNFLYNLKLFDETNQKSLVLRKQFQQMADKMFSYRPEMSAIYIFNTRGNSEYRLSGEYFRAEDHNPLELPWFKEAIEHYGKPLVIGTHTLPGAFHMNGQPMHAFSVARAIVDVDAMRVIGVLLIHTNFDRLSSLAEQMRLYPNQKIYIADSDGNAIYSDASSELTRPIPSSILQLTNKTKYGDATVRTEGVDYRITFYKSELGWTVINLIPETDLFQSIDRIRIFTVAVLCLLLALVLLFVVWLHRQIASPLRVMTDEMRRIENGRFDVHIPITNRNEIGQLAKSFNSMAARIEQLIQEVYHDKIQQKELELLMLQHQINPHFLYNALESIHMMAEINEDEEVSRMSRALGKMLRYGLSSQNTSATVREELEHVQQYVQFQQVRYSNTFTVVIHVDPSLLNCHIQKLIVQPLVENAIEHGLAGISEGGVIRIVGEMLGNKLCISVIDNGNGMSTERMEALNRQLHDLESNDRHSESIGLRNVSKRLQLDTEPGELSISNSPCGGTSAQLLLSRKQHIG